VQGSWGAFLKPASFQGRLCFGPNDGQRVRFASRDAPALGDEIVPVDVEGTAAWMLRADAAIVLLVSGRMEGVWKYDRTGKRVLVAIEPFGKLAKWARTPAEADRRGSPSSWRLARVDLGPLGPGGA
jgi:hypothetical protein